MRGTLLLVILSLAFGETKLPPSASRRIDFEKDVQPVLSQKCYSCHGEDVQQSGLRLDKPRRSPLIRSSRHSLRPPAPAIPQR